MPRHGGLQHPVAHGRDQQRAGLGGAGCQACWADRAPFGRVGLWKVGLTADSASLAACATGRDRPSFPGTVDPWFLFPGLRLLFPGPQTRWAPRLNPKLSGAGSRPAQPGLRPTAGPRFLHHDLQQGKRTVQSRVRAVAQFGKPAVRRFGEAVDGDAIRSRAPFVFPNPFPRLPKLLVANRKSHGPRTPGTSNLPVPFPDRNRRRKVLQLSEFSAACEDSGSGSRRPSGVRFSAPAWASAHGPGGELKFTAAR